MLRVAHSRLSQKLHCDESSESARGGQIFLLVKKKLMCGMASFQQEKQLCPPFRIKTRLEANFDTEKLLGIESIGI